MTTAAAVPREVRLHDCKPPVHDLREEFLFGLRQPQKRISSKFLYDKSGSQLFDRICQLDEYYPTRTETAILRERAGEIAGLIGPKSLLIEPGSGASQKTRILLDHLPELAGYVPVDISRRFLLQAAQSVAADYPDLEVLPVCADYTCSFDLPEPVQPPALRVLFFPGSTIGNFAPSDAEDFLRQFDCDAFLIGVDLRKDVQILERAYDDAEGVTAAFNLNILQRANVELDAGFDLRQFRHFSFYNESAHRIEMHLISMFDQAVRVAGKEIDFRQNEHIVTEYSYKYTVEGFRALAAAAGLRPVEVWSDSRGWFSLHYLQRQ